MSGEVVRQAARKALFSREGGQARAAAGPGGIGTVLRELHQPVISEPLPPRMQALLAALDRAEARGRQRPS
jgi:hypothetical protein